MSQKSCGLSGVGDGLSGVGGGDALSDVGEMHYLMWGDALSDVGDALSDVGEMHYLMWGNALSDVGRKSVSGSSRTVYADFRFHKVKSIYKSLLKSKRLRRNFLGTIQRYP